MCCTDQIGYAGSSLEGISLDVGGLIGKICSSLPHVAFVDVAWKDKGGGYESCCLVQNCLNTGSSRVARPTRSWGVHKGGPLLPRTSAPRPSKTESRQVVRRDKDPRFPICARQAANTRTGTAKKTSTAVSEPAKETPHAGEEMEMETGQANSETLALCSIKHFPLQIPNAFARDADQITSMKRRGDAISTLKKDRLINSTRRCISDTH